jgi:adenylate cyclase
MDFSGKPAEAVGVAEKAMRLDPRNRDYYLLFEGASYTQMGRYEEAIPIFKRFLVRYPNIWSAHGLLVVDYTELGREDEARAEAAEVLRISPHFSLDRWMQISPQKDQAFLKRVITDGRKAGLK